MSITSTPTAMYALAYLAHSWKNRGSLSKNERKGFGQFFYVTLCGSMEHLLSEAIQTRIFSFRGVAHAIHDEQADTQGQETKTAPDLSIAKGLAVLVNSVERETLNAPLIRLIELHKKVFDLTVPERIGNELHNDLMAMADLRNLFAHGRMLRLTFGDDNDRTGQIDKTAINAAALRLQAAGILKSVEFDRRSHNDFVVKFYADDAMLYFYAKAREIEKKILDTTESHNEAFWLRTSVLLPDLDGLPPPP